MPQAPRAAVVSLRRPAAVARCGAELVGLAERFYLGIWTSMLLFVAFAALAACAFLGMRGLPADAPIGAALAATGTLAVLALAGAWRAAGLYRTLRAHPRLELVAVLAAGALVAHPDLAGELWWPSCALVMAIAVVASLRRTAIYAAAVLVCNLAGHVVAGDFADKPAVAVVGLWIGYPAWVGMIAVGTELLARHVLRIDAPAAARLPPRRVVAWNDPWHDVTSVAGDGCPRTATAAADVTVADPSPAATTGRLSAREIQVVTLLADGLRHRDIAACLSISERQVQRLVAQAVARAGARSTYELVALVAAELLASDLAPPPHADDPG